MTKDYTGKRKNELVDILIKFSKISEWNIMSEDGICYLFDYMHTKVLAWTNP